MFPSAPVQALVEEYRSGEAAPRPLLKRARHEGRPPGEAPPALVPWSAEAIRSVLAGASTVAVREDAREPDLDLAQRIAAELGIPLTILDSAGLERLANGLR